MGNEILVDGARDWLLGAVRIGEGVDELCWIGREFSSVWQRVLHNRDLLNVSFKLSNVS